MLPRPPGSPGNSREFKEVKSRSASRLYRGFLNVTFDFCSFRTVPRIESITLAGE